MQDASFTHFMYLEDDILITRDNMSYWLEGRELLREFDFIPSFLRVEQRAGSQDWYSTDCPQSYHVNHLPRAKLSNDLTFVNLPTPYQGMYLLDRDLMAEHLSGPSSSPDFGPWAIREKAAQGITFARVRPGFTSRNLIPFRDSQRQVDQRCLIHHTPNNYANQHPRTNQFGSVLVRDLLLA